MEGIYGIASTSRPVGSADVNRYVNASDGAREFVSEVLADSTRTDPLWLGFVEKAADLNALVSNDVTGYMVLLPAEAPRHVRDHHEWDGGTQRPVTADDYRHMLSVLNDADSLKTGSVEDGRERVVASKAIAKETFKAVFEVRPGKKNRSLALVTLAIKTAR